MAPCTDQCKIDYCLLAKYFSKISINSLRGMYERRNPDWKVEFLETGWQFGQSIKVRLSFCCANADDQNDQRTISFQSEM